MNSSGSVSVTGSKWRIQTVSASERMKINQIEGSNRFPFGAWDIIGLFGSSALLCAVSLLLAIGPYWIATYYGYFRHPLIFLMNWLPILIVQALLLMVFNRQWLAFLGNCIFTMIPAVGNFYKWQLRNEPFQFSDFSSIGAGLEVAGDYNLSFNPRIGVAVFFVLAGTICMAWLFHGRLEKKKRLIWFAILCISLWPTWKLLYADDDRPVPPENGRKKPADRPGAGLFGPGGTAAAE